MLSKQIFIGNSISWYHNGQNLTLISQN
uniref:Uncharacterized protein n=1 Tax=Anguilla anguilla TaxID=7936 RepID=A0A0E9U6G8_ANGAN